MNTLPLRFRPSCALSLVALFASSVGAWAADLMVNQSNPPYSFSTGSASYDNIYVGNISNGILNQSGGTLGATTGRLYVGFAASSTYNLTGGTLNTLASDVGEYSTGVFNLSGSGVHNVTGSAGLTLAVNSGNRGTYNLNGGTLSTTLVGGGAGTSTFNFNGGTLQAGQSTSSFFQGLTTANVQAGGATISTQGFNVTIAQNLVSGTGSGTADGGLTKLGAGTLTLTGANTYTGVTTVSAGTLTVASGGSVTGSAVNVGGGATLAISGSGSVSPGSGATLTVDGSGGTASVTLGDTGTLSTGTATVGNTGTGTFTQTGGSFTTNGNELRLGYIGGVRGGAQGTYNLSAGTLNAGLVTLGNSGTGTFMQSGGTATATSLILGATGDGVGSYTLSGGSLTTTSVDFVGYNGMGTFTQTGGSFTNLSLVLGGSAANGSILYSTYYLNGGMLTTGGVSGSNGRSVFRFNGGTLQAGTSTANFFQGLTYAYVDIRGAKIDTNGVSVTVAQNLMSSTGGETDGGLTKTGAGTLTLSGANTYTGNTTVNAGTLLAANTSGSATGSGQVSVGNGATLGGNGTIGGAVTVQSGGTLAPGALAISKLTVGNALSLAAGSTLAITIGGTTAGSGYDEIQVGGRLTLQGALSVHTVNSFQLAPGETFTILDNTGTLPTVGTFSNATGTLYTDAAGDTFVVNYAANVDGGTVPDDVTLMVLTVVPEPSTWAFLFVGVGGFLFAIRRQSRQMAA